MRDRFLWKIGGEAGFGIMTTGLNFSKIAARSGFYIFDCFEYPSLIRGGHNTYETIISKDPVYATRNEVDLLVCLNKETFELHKNRLHTDSLVVFDEENFQIPDGDFHKLAIPMKKILREQKGSMVMMNNVALAASLSLLNWPYEEIEKIIIQSFKKKGQNVIDLNARISRMTYDYVTEQYEKHIVHDFLPTKNPEKKVVLTGNDAFSLAAIAADCRFYAAYPMTPASTVLTTMAGLAEKTGMVVRHAEDEISVINTALGASVAGVRSSVGTSGGGFALMTEAVSFAGIGEIPIVIFLSQRPGPATGLPTWTEQGDLLFAVNAGHGEFPKIILAPGDTEEMFALTMRAFDLADTYQTPVIILSDKHLSESTMSIPAITLKLSAKSNSPDRGKRISKAENYLRYAKSADGISPLLIPGAPHSFYQINSYEHEEDGHTTEDAQMRVEQVEKRNKKTQTYLQKDFKMPETHGNMADAEIIFVSWGSNKGAILEAQKVLASKLIKTAFIHFTHVFPMDEKKILPLFEAKKRYILVENNSHGQFGKLLREQTGVVLTEKILKYDGRQLYVEEIVEYVTV
ncbi:hypothetical protein A3H83_04070 [Candidatus Roizmanbacteria bacterium RIFCSPLOWO2_02_FULL_39_8]|nr:MAG: hypothetical protein A3H83_04070 [Candidatus Roizmanbacteria bacterium RIFCSPLOWO2_02_FULL_39_8]